MMNKNVRMRMRGCENVTILDRETGTERYRKRARGEKGDTGSERMYVCICMYV